jgi:hypothetical protein
MIAIRTSAIATDATNVVESLQGFRAGPMNE